MAKEAGSTADKLSALVAEIEAEAYARGKADARTECLQALGTSNASAPTRRGKKPSGARPARKRRAGGSKRAPRGSVRALVERALRDRVGLTAAEIIDRAGTDAERMVKLSSIGMELTKGRRLGRYASAEGRWSLAASPSEDGEGAPDAPASPEPDAATDAPAGDAPGDDTASSEAETGGGQSRLGMNW